MSTIERRATVTANPRGEIEFVAVAYNTLDAYKTVFLPGCATASLNKRLPPICFDHDTGRVIGRATSWRDSPQGPVVTARLDNDPRVPDAQRVIAQVESGTLQDVSIGFAGGAGREPTKAEMQRWPGVTRVYPTVDLLEVSVVFLHAVEGSSILALRSRGSDRGALSAMLARGEISADAWRAQRRLHADLDAGLATKVIDRSRDPYSDPYRDPYVVDVSWCRPSRPARRSALGEALDAIGRRRR